MTINKLTAGSKGNPFNSKGKDVANAVNALIDGAVQSESLKSLKPIDGLVQSVGAFYNNGTGVGGQFAYKDTMSATNHNGGTIIAAAAIAAWNGTQADIDTLLNWTGSTNGCYVRQLLAVTAKPELDTGMFGAVKDVTVDSSLSTAKCCVVAKDLKIDTVYLLPEQGFASSVYVPVGVNVIGTGRDSDYRPILVEGDLALIGGWIFLFNSLDGVTWVDDFPNSPSGGLFRARLNNVDQIAGVRFAIGFGSYKFEDLRGRWSTQMVKRPSGLYTDNFEARGIYAEPVMGNDYQIEVRGLGDGMIIEGCHFPWNSVNPNGTPNGIYVGATLGGRISECVGGNVRVDQGTVTIANCHFEKSQVLVDSANVTIENTVLGPDTVAGLKCISTNNQTHSIHLSRVEFLYLDGVLEWEGPDIIADNRFTITIEDCYKKWSKSGSVDKMQLSGIKIAKPDNSPITEFNDFSYVFSKAGRIDANYSVEQDFSVNPSDNTFPGVSSASSDSATTWSASTGTYYYRCQLMLDVNRLIGRNQANAEVSLSLTNGGSGARVTIDMGTRKNVGIYRIYRGNTTGSYDSYADIHTYNTYLLYDDGETVNGIPWMSRAAGAVGTINGIGEKSLQYRGGNLTCHAVTTPTVGVWPVGDDIMRVTPAAGGTRGFALCDGSVWKAWGAISA